MLTKKKWNFIQFMAENDQTTYEFSITVVGTGETVDDAFQNALDELSVDPYSVITNEVICATGRTPNIKNLGLEKLGINLNTVKLALQGNTKALGQMSKAMSLANIKTKQL